MILRGSPSILPDRCFQTWAWYPKGVFALDRAQIADEAACRLESKEATMSTALQDPTLPRDPSAPHGFSEIEGEAELKAPRTLAEELLGEPRGGAAASETSFELAYHGPVE